MKIAVIAPSPVPDTIGGTEIFVGGLTDAINRYTSHRGELIKLPAPEHSFWDLIDSYERFARLDLSRFDRVISTKYPSWMVAHPDHWCYMVHRLRGLYDTYGGDPRSSAKLFAHPAIAPLLRFLQERAGQREALPELFARLQALRQADLPEEAFAFPGPLIRMLVHALDGIGLAPCAVKRYCAIASNVAGRADYFPPGADVEVIHPASTLAPAPPGDFRQVFTVSRLDPPKRIDLLVRAMRSVKADIPLKIAGSGPQRAMLEALAAGDPRIEFLGFVENDRLAGLYADALVVPFVPYDEDYGLVTIEAMASGKPVITTHDAGEVNVFVQDGVTGFSVPPRPEAIAEKIDYLAQHPDEARRMGLQARERVREITWPGVMAHLFPGEVRLPASVKLRGRAKPRMTVTTTFPIHPPRGGGQNRIYYLYRELAASFDLEIVCITAADQDPFDGFIAPGVREVRIPKSKRHEEAERKVSERLDGVPVTDVVMPEFYGLTPAYLDALALSTQRAEVVVASHPYLYPALAEVAAGKTLWYEAQDIEVDLKRSILPKGPLADKYLELTESTERACCKAAEVITTCSQEDADTLEARFGAHASRLYVVANGFDPATVPFVPFPARLACKARLGLERSFTALFMGSWHGPNVDAARRVLQLAAHLPQMRFLIVGSVGFALRGTEHPANVGMMGVVDDLTKEVLLGLADVALNPVVSGSGTNLKMLDYCGAGIPILTTPYGLRGLAFKADTHVMVRPVDRFAEALAECQAGAGNGVAERVVHARALAEQTYSWSSIARKFEGELSARRPDLLPG